MPDEGMTAQRVARLRCVRPVRLWGQLAAVDSVSGETRPVGVAGETLVACKDRRDQVCEPCAETYGRDAWHMVAAGLRGREEDGAGGERVTVVPASVAGHPRLFVTLTAPSFGAVHAAREGKRCRPRRAGGVCRHGWPVGCRERHGPQDGAVGSPLCAECYDYTGLVLFNACVGELWRRMVIAVRRELAKRVGVPVRRLREALRLSFAKVLEGQARGVVHVHAVVRLDGVNPDDPAAVVSPPLWANAELLADAVRAAIGRVTVPVPTHDGDERVMCWGEQHDIRLIASGTETQPEKIAAYIAKYTTKAIAAGYRALSKRLTHEDMHTLGVAKLPAHVRRLVWTAWDMGRFEVYRKLNVRRWAHQFGARGHVQSKSRYYGVTMGHLRNVRRDYRVARDQRIAEEETLVGSWRYVATGYATWAERNIAETLARTQAAVRAQRRREKSASVASTTR